MIACVDVDYRKAGAVAAAVWFSDWRSVAVDFQAVASIPSIAEYQPGAFYQRELPCLLEVLPKGPPADIIIVDGYVWLADNVKGLGAHLHDALGVKVIGVAKTRYSTAEQAMTVCRGSSTSPLYVTSIGIPTNEAAAHIAAMHGPFRVPSMLRLVDTLARTAVYDGSTTAMDNLQNH